MIKRTSNTVGLKWRWRGQRKSITFWKRAMASCGWTECYRSDRTFYFALHAWGWAISVELYRREMPHKNQWTPYHHSYFHVYLPWLAYDVNRGGAFTYWRNR